MNYKSTDICICGHTKKYHYQDEIPLCVACANGNNGSDVYWHKFKLDNLKYLEHIHELRNSNT